MDNSLTESLTSLSASTLRPKRTSYSNMSTWFFMKNNPREKTEIFYQMGDILVKQRPTTTVHVNQQKSDSNEKQDKLVLPDIVGPFKIDDKINKDEEIRKNGLISETLMKNWSDKRIDTNTNEKKWNREGRGGGVWNNVRESLRESGNRLLFIQGNARSYQNLQKLNSTSDFGSYVHEYRRPYIPIKQRDKLCVQTKHSVEFGNWNILR